MANFETTDVPGVFSQLVLRDLDEFDESEWQKWRQLPLFLPAIMILSGLSRTTSPLSTRQKFVRENLFYINMRPSDYVALGEHIEIAQINDQPLNCFPAAGVYAWLFPDQASTIMLWLSWPAQPPGW